MHTSKNLSRVGSALPRLGVFAVVVAVVGGILGMHVMGVFQGSVKEPAVWASTVLTTTPGMEMGAPHGAAFPSVSSTPRTVPAVAAKAAAVQPGHPVHCGGAFSGGQPSMDGQDTCATSLWPAMVELPLPGVLSRRPADTAFTGAPGPKSRGRVPDPPSLIQLSIIRT